MRYRFGDFEFDTELTELRQSGAASDAPHSALELLSLLLEHSGRIVTKQELVERLWDGRAISDDAIAKRVSLLRKALGEKGREAVFVQSVYGKGVRFRGEVQLLDGPARAAMPTNAGTNGDAPPAPPHERPSIAVLPFRLTGIAGPHGAIAEGLPDEIITMLARLRWLFVIARGSTFRFSSFASEPAEIRKALGVRYAVSGSVEVLQGNIKVYAELSDLETHELVWSDRFCDRIEAVQEMRDAIVTQVVSSVEAEIPQHEARLARMKPVDSLSAWERFHLGFGKIFTAQKIDLAGAVSDFESAIAMQPDFARAYSGLAHAGWAAILNSPQGDVDEVRSRMTEAMDKAIAYDARDPFVTTTAGRIRYIGGDVAGAIAAFHRAIETSPSYAQAFAALGGIESLGGDPERGVRDNLTALKLSPLDPNHDSVIGAQIIALLRLGQRAEAAQWADRVREPSRLSLQVQTAALVAYHQAGRTQNARVVAQRIAQSFPGVSADNHLDALPMITQDLREFLREAYMAYGLS